MLRFNIGVVLTFVSVMVYAQGNISIHAPVVGVLPQKMQMNGTAVLGNRLYVYGGDLAGGSDTKWTSEVRSAAISPTDNGLSDWQNEPALPELLTYLSNSSAVINDRVYIMCGLTALQDNIETATKRANSVYWSEAGADGRLKPWQKGPNVPGTGIFFTANCADGNRLYVTGGLSTKGEAGIYFSEVSSTGQPGEWRNGGRLPINVYNHGACIQRGRLYIWGGLITASQVNNQVYSAPINSAGDVGQWRQEKPMPQGLYGSAYVGINDFLVAICGAYKVQSGSSDIWFAQLAHGEVWQWQQASSDMNAKRYLSAGLRPDGWVFVTGGSTGTGNSASLLTQVQAFQIPKPPSSQQAANGASAPGELGSGLASMDNALQQARATQKNVLAFFYTPGVKGCTDFWTNVAGSAAYRTAASGFIQAGVDTTRDAGQWTQKAGVFKVPTLAIISPQGAVEKSTVDLDSVSKATGFLQ